MMKKVLAVVLFGLMTMCNVVFADDADIWVDMPVFKGLSTSLNCEQCIQKLGGEKALLAVEEENKYGMWVNAYFAPGCYITIYRYGRGFMMDNPPTINIKNPNMKLDNYNVKVGDHIQTIRQNMGNYGKFNEIEKYLEYNFDYIHPRNHTRTTATIWFLVDDNYVVKQIMINH